MILVTVGGQLPFDRMVQIVDAWAEERRRDDVFAQIGAGSYTPSTVKSERFVAPAEFRAQMQSASYVVAHAGMGTILLALELGKPLLLFPRRRSFKEHRNDHQVDTAHAFSSVEGVAVAFDEAQLRSGLDHLPELPPPLPIGARAPERLVARLREFLAEP